MVTLYWATQTIASSMRDYMDNRWLAAELSLADAVTAYLLLSGSIAWARCTTAGITC